MATRDEKRPEPVIHPVKSTVVDQLKPEPDIKEELELVAGAALLELEVLGAVIKQGARIAEQQGEPTTTDEAEEPVAAQRGDGPEKAAEPEPR